MPRLLWYFEQTSMKTILTGIQPSGALHLGNYFGAIQPAVEMAKQGQAVYFIADYHALTSISKADDLRRYTFDAAAGVSRLRARSGQDHPLSPKRRAAGARTGVAAFGRHADGPARARPQLQGQDRAGRGAEPRPLRVPVLMAADILLYNSDLVPVGKDQKQHLEIARDIAQKFNDRFGPVFKLPEPVIREATAIVPGIDGRKMSKSYGNTIPLFGEEKAIKKPVMAIKTDSTPIDQPKQIEGTVLGQLMQAVECPEIREIQGLRRRARHRLWRFEKGSAGGDPGAVPPFHEKYDHYQAHPDEIEAMLRDGANRARELAAPVLENARKATGLSK